MSGLVAEGISKSYRQKNAVQQLSFTVAPGQAYCLLGGNGAGKSTCINMMLGQLKPDAGTLRFCQWDLWADRNGVRERLFYLPDQVSLYPELSAVENIRYFASLASLVLQNESIESALAAMGLPEEAWHKRSQEYSKGMRQKVALALVKLKEPQLLILDEPTTGLDPQATREFVALIDECKRAKTCVFMVTHDLQCAHLLADDIGILQNGKLCQQLSNNNLSLDELEHHYFSSVS